MSWYILSKTVAITFYLDLSHRHCASAIHKHEQEQCIFSFMRDDDLCVICVQYKKATKRGIEMRLYQIKTSFVIMIFIIYNNIDFVTKVFIRSSGHCA